MLKKVQKSKIKNQNLEIVPGGKLNNYLNNWSGKLINLRRSKTSYLLVLVLALLLLVFYKKSWFVAALVNGTPITNFELQSKLNQQFKTQVLNQLINEKIIMSEAAKSNAVPSEVDVTNKIGQLEKSVGGKDVLDSLLTQQGQTRTSLRDQVRVQLAITKLYEKEATVSSEEVAKFIEQNKNQMKATESAQQEIEATENIKNQKLSQIFSQKFQALRQKAKIQIF